MDSKNYKYWKSLVDPKRCKPCEYNHGQIYDIDQVVEPAPPVHEYCRCIIAVLEAIQAGKATKNGINGADAWLIEFGQLPPYYITAQEAKQLGYRNRRGNLDSVAPGKMLTKGVYANHDGHLPEAEGRVWWEADINYEEGYRGTERIVFSNNGLIFVTYDHFRTFSEIVKGE